MKKKNTLRSPHSKSFPFVLCSLSPLVYLLRIHIEHRAHSTENISSFALIKCISNIILVDLWCVASLPSSNAVLSVVWPRDAWISLTIGRTYVYIDLDESWNHLIRFIFFCFVVSCGCDVYSHKTHSHVRFSLDRPYTRVRVRLCACVGRDMAVVLNTQNNYFILCFSSLVHNSRHFFWWIRINQI